MSPECRDDARALTMAALPIIQGYLNAMYLKSPRGKVSLGEAALIAEKVAPRFVELILEVAEPHESGLAEYLSIEVRRVITRHLSG